jgi:hypothetical protein
MKFLCLIFVVPPDNSNIWFIPSISTNFPRTVECIADNGVLPASNRIFTINIECKLKMIDQYIFEKRYLIFRSTCCDN